MKAGKKGAKNSRQDEEQIDTSSGTKKKQQKEERVEDKTAQEYYDAFNFEQTVRTFSDFL